MTRYIPPPEPGEEPIIKCTKKKGCVEFQKDDAKFTVCGTFPDRMKKQLEKMGWKQVIVRETCIECKSS